MSDAQKYQPPEHLITAAENALKVATEAEIDAARRLYGKAYCGVTENRSAVTGVSLPDFDACPTLVRAGWLAVAQEARAMFAPAPPGKDASTEPAV